MDQQVADVSSLDSQVTSTPVRLKKSLFLGFICIFALISSFAGGYVLGRNSIEKIPPTNLPDIDLTASTTSSVSPQITPPSGITSEPTFVNGRQVLLMGFVDMEAIDQDGNRTGLMKSGAVEENASQTSYSEIGDSKSIFVRGTGSYVITIKAREPGMFELRLRSVVESEIERFVFFADVPMLSANSTAQIVFKGDGLKQKDVLVIDQEGDGTYETTILPTGEVEGVQAKDEVQPEISIKLSGEEINGGKFLDSVLVTIDAKDNPGGAGVASVEYTLDGGETVNKYTDPFTIIDPGDTTIEVKIYDKAGNQRYTTTSIFVVPDNSR